MFKQIASGFDTTADVQWQGIYCLRLTNKRAIQEALITSWSSCDMYTCRESHTYVVKPLRLDELEHKLCHR